jgi:hypothetical protein
MDNLAAAMHGADENNIVGVGTALSTLRYACGHATVIIVHHSGHDTTRLRGHSVLQGSFDAIIRVGNSKAMQPARLLEVGKQRDASDNVLPIRFTLSPVGITGRPEEETACVVKCAPHVPRKPADTPSANESSQLSDVARLVFETFSPLSRGDPVPEKLLKEAVIKQVMTTSGDPVSKEAAAKRYLRGRDALLKDGKLLRDPANQANLQLAA